MHPTAAAAGPIGRGLAWAGGVAFVASLLFCGWSYLGPFADPDAGRGQSVPRAIAIDVLLFGVFALHHSLLARARVKTLITRIVPAALERSVYVWVASVLLVWTCAAWQPIPGTVYDLPHPWRAGGYLVQAIGLWLTVRAVRVIDPLDLAGLRQAYGARPAAQFRVIGPYHRVRHPIYLGWVCLTFGAPHMTATRLAFAAISTAYLMAAVPFEERSLIGEFGDEYRAYQQRVRWRMLPFVY